MKTASPVSLRDRFVVAALATRGTRKSWFRKALAARLSCGLIVSILACHAHAALGDVATTYSFPASAFAMSPTQPVMYATIPSQNSLAIIDTNTLAYETVLVGSGPLNLALSPDGLTAYIANSTSSFVAVFDTQSRKVVNSFAMPEQPRDVVVGNQNRLFVLTQNHIYQIDATTGASSGPNVETVGIFVYSGSLEISPDRNTLYYGQQGLSSSTMYKVDVSGTTPSLLLQTQTGSNGHDLTLTHDGNSICQPNGAPYQVAKYRTSDFANLGSYNTGAYPEALAFSPDDLVAYASVDGQGGIKVFDANTFLGVGMITGPDVAGALRVESSGRYLFAGYTVSYGSFQGTKVYDTGRGPTPSSTPSPPPTATPTPTAAPGGFGTVAATYSFAASAFAISPTQPETMYATIPSQNSVAIINTNTLSYETAFVGSGPTNLALSPDGLTAYVANNSSSFVAVFDTQSRKVINSLLISEQPRDVVVGNQNRLFVLTTSHIYQIDATTGASTGPSISGMYGGSLEISPDRNTLYYGEPGGSPSAMYKYDISGTTPTLLLHTQTGSNGHDLTLSHDGSSICHPNGAPYQIARYRTSDFAILGSFDTGPYPLALSFSPDDSVAYASVDGNGAEIKVFDANSFLATGTIASSAAPGTMQVDSANKYLFAGYTDSNRSFVGTKVYNIAPGAPTPTPSPTATPTPTSLGNISTRLRVEAGDNALIGGFIVRGTQPKKVIVRALGPSLASSIPGALADPILELHDSSGALIASNDNWRSDQEAEINATLPPTNDLESAIVRTLAANGSSYTAVVRGANNGTGVGMVEVYDLDGTADSNLANISTRGLVQTGDDVMIAGTIVVGPSTQKVLVRALGPSLPVPGKLPDPRLELRDQNGVLLRANDNWRSDQEAEILATNIPPSDNLEAALIQTLPGNNARYTAIVSGVGASTGVALVEVYALP